MLAFNEQKLRERLAKILEVDAQTMTVWCSATSLNLQSMALDLATGALASTAWVTNNSVAYLGVRIAKREPVIFRFSPENDDFLARLVSRGAFVLRVEGMIPATVLVKPSKALVSYLAQRECHEGV